MIGVAEYKLRALNGDSLPQYHGQLLHGLCFKLIENYSKELSAKIHKTEFIKPFTLANLEFEKKILPKNKRYYVNVGDILYWRVSALQDDVLKAFLSVQKGDIFRLGKLEFITESVIIDDNIRKHTGLINPENMVEECFLAPPPSQITMCFHSPTTFKCNSDDYPWPLPELVFGSIADKWTAMNMPLNIDSNSARETAKLIIPKDWQGESLKVFFSDKRGTRGFKGKFTYSLKRLSMRDKQIITLLAAYAELSGVGRWTAHGLGQVKIII